MKDIIKQLAAGKVGNFKIKDHAPDFTGKFEKEEAEILLESLKSEMAEMQERLYAANKQSVLIIFQAMDAAGKDSVIKHTMSGLNPQGCQVYSFKQPSSEELDHDFLWRHYKALPEKGRIGIHNRSHYENVLVCKVHPEYVLAEGVSGIATLSDVDHKFWKTRYESIRNFEKHLSENGTIILKFFLNLSKDEQKERFIQRLDDPLKHWKFSGADLSEREKWDEYMTAYEDAINETSTDYAPWYIIPADKKWFTRVSVCAIIRDRLKQLNLDAPEPDEADKTKLEEYKARLMDE